MGLAADCFFGLGVSGGCRLVVAGFLIVLLSLCGCWGSVGRHKSAIGCDWFLGSDCACLLTVFFII